MTLKQGTSLAGHWAILAGLRFFLSVVVVLGHFVLMVRPDTHHLFGDGYFNPLSAVYGFFILSGYSIAASLDREKSGFFHRRFVRIWPLYLATIAFGLAVYLLVPNGFTWPLGQAVPLATPLSIIASVLMLQTIIAGPIPMVGPIWSLSGEWWHYVIAPLLNRLSNKLLILWMLVSFAFFIHLHGPERGVACMDGFTGGRAIAGLSWVWVTGFLYYRMRGTTNGFILLIAPSLFALTIRHSPGVPMFITAFVLVLSENARLSKKSLSALNFLGDWSYPLYLLHIPAFIAALTLGSNRSAITLAAAFGTSLAALYLVDYPSRKIFARKKVSVVTPKTSSVTQVVGVKHESI